ncbi:MAG: PAS domain-containing protein [Ruminococcus sp.]|nr:PAS domain-containing protein [Ruminococcus sp.]
MIKNEFVINDLDNTEEAFFVDGYHRCCLEEGEEHDYLDQSFLDLLGYAADEFGENSSRHFVDLIEENDRVVYSALMQKLKKGGMSGKIKYRIKTGSGDYLLAEECFNSLCSCSGKTWALGVVKKIGLTNNLQDGFEAKYEVIDVEDAPFGIMRCSFEEYPRILSMNLSMMGFIGASIFNDYKLYAENVFFMISNAYRNDFRELLSKLSTFSDPVFISHDIVKIDGDSGFFSGWGWVEYDENRKKQFVFYYGIPSASVHPQENREDDFISSLKSAYNLIIKLDIEKGTAECLYKSVERPIGISYDVELTIDSAKKFFLTNYIVKEDCAVFEKFIDDIVSFSSAVDSRNRHADFSVVLDDGVKRRYHAISMKLNSQVVLICMRDISDIKYSSELENKSKMLHKLWRNLNHFNFRNNTEAITFEDRGEFIFPIYCSDKLCERMSVTEADFYKIADKGITKKDFFERMGIDAKTYDELINHKCVKFFVPDETSGRKGFSAKLVASVESIYTVLLFNGQIPEEFSVYPPDSSQQANENNSDIESFVPGNKSRIWIRTFGSFDLFLDGVPIRFPSAKAKELLAILVDRRGGSLTAEQAIGYLWEDRIADKQAMSNYRKVAMKLQNTLNQYNIGDIIINNRGVRSLNMSIVDCDYFRYLKNDENNMDVFHGQYMQDYSWGESTLAAMLNTANLTNE